MEITKDDLSDGQVADLLRRHLNEMQKYSPPSSIHALDESKLKDPTIQFWSARQRDMIMGCGALKQLSQTSAELKSMKTADAFLRQGVAQKILTVLLEEAATHQYETLYLETGTHSAFDPAVALYKRFGFVECAPFEGYEEDPHSRFFMKSLS